MDEIGYVIIQIFLLLLLAEVFGKIVKRFGLPEMVGYIIAGILFVNIADLFPEVSEWLHFDIIALESDENHFINVMGQLGLIFLLFSIGLETKLSELMDIGRTALIVAAMGIIVPFIGGYCVYFLFGSDPNTAIMVGTAIFAMSTVVSAEILRGLGITDTKEGKTIIGVAIFSDILCLILLAVNSSIVSPVHEHALWMNILVIILFVAFAFLFIHRTSKRAEKWKEIVHEREIEVKISHSDLFLIGFVICLGLTALSYVVGLSGIIGAFLAGMYFAEFEASTHIREKFDTLTKFLLPFFFIYVGLKLQFNQMTSDVILIAVILVIVAIVTKYAGGMIGCKICKVDTKLSRFVSSCMVARGDISIIVATFAHSIGLFDTNLYAAVILTAVLTQVIAPTMIYRSYRSLKAGNDTGPSD